MRIRSIAIGLTIAAIGTAMLSSVALADTLTVTITPNTTSYNGTALVGKQTTVVSEVPGTTYSGTYSATGALNSNGCVSNPQTVFNYPSANASITLNFQSPLCVSSNPPITFTIASGTGIFTNANGSGTATYDVNTLTFTTSSGSGFSPSNTPELDTIYLFGSGALGLAGYALIRYRGRRRRPLAD